jgi:hypothetical protein
VTYSNHSVACGDGIAGPGTCGSVPGMGGGVLADQAGLLRDRELLAA